jgi:hypothetical protein
MNARKWKQVPPKHVEIVDEIGDAEWLAGSVE